MGLPMAEVLALILVGATEAAPQATHLQGVAHQFCDLPRACAGVGEGRKRQEYGENAAIRRQMPDGRDHRNRC
jgi:hypothetical protein